MSARPDQPAPATRPRVTDEGPRRVLGTTGLEVSTLGFGTVELGMSYGLPKDGVLPRAPTMDAAVALLLAAFAAGVDIVDTAPGYGRAEMVVGAALARWPGRRPVVATKVPCPGPERLRDRAGLAAALRASVDRSLGRLGLERVDILQVHNATPEALASRDFGAALRTLVDDGLAAHLGASTYGPEAAEAAIAAPWCETLQVAYNLLDQDPASRCIDRARDAGVGVLVRSALLKGVLADGGNGGRAGAALPPNLRPLAARLERAAAVAEESGQTLPELALRFVLSDPRVDCALVGIDRPDYLDVDVAVWRAPPLPERTRAALRELHEGGPLTDPRTWGF